MFSKMSPCLKLAFAAALLAWLSLADVNIEKTHSLPPGWIKKTDKVDPNETFSFSIALKQPEMKTLDTILTSKHTSTLSRDQVNKMRAPATESVTKVEAWLSSHGIKHFETKNGWIKARATVQQTNALIRADLKPYIYDGHDKTVLRTRQYSIPDALQDHIQFVHPVANFMRPFGTTSRIRRPLNHKDVHLSKRDAPPCTTAITPQCVRDIYSFNYATPDNKSSVMLGIAGFLEQYANYADSDHFIRKYAPDVFDKGYNYTVELINGGENHQQVNESGNEASLDLDYTLGLAYPAKLVFYSTGGRGEAIEEDGKSHSDSTSTNEPFVDMFQYLLDKEDGEIPTVLSISYSDDEVSVPRPYAKKVCSMIGLLAGRGVTVLMGSGDGGAQGGHYSNCRTRDGSNRKIAMTTFPSTCPWLLAVGAVTNDATPAAASFSTGGFSQYFEQPAYQREVVGEYVRELAGHLDGYYDAKMRAIPDLSAVGTNLMIVNRGELSTEGGTSASTPIIASMLAAVNDARARAGKRPLGWANKFLYQPKVRATLRDITSGESDSCDYDGEKPGGWPAKPGWDAVTGLGVPGKFDEFLKALVEADDDEYV